MRLSSSFFVAYIIVPSSSGLWRPYWLYGYVDPTFGLLVVLHLILTILLARSFMAGLASARDPAHRVTPVGPRYFFRKFFWQRVHRQLPYFFPCAMFLISLPFTFNSRPLMMTPRELFHSFMELSLLFVALILTTHICFLFCAPRMRSPVALVAISFTICVAVDVMMIEISQEFFPRRPWMPHGRPSWMPFWGRSTYDPITLRLLTPIIAAWALACGWARHKGDAWFRLEDDA